jgi:hypothetical protein
MKYVVLMRAGVGNGVERRECVNLSPRCGVKEVVLWGEVVV